MRGKRIEEKLLQVVQLHDKVGQNGRKSKTVKCSLETHVFSKHANPSKRVVGGCFLLKESPGRTTVK